MTGMERAAFCNTGSEAVMSAIRIARAVTGRNKIVFFEKDYHGNFDNVLARSRNINGKLSSLPITQGIPNAVVEDVVLLPYNTPESLEFLKANVQDFGAVLVEPVQSRHPYVRPKAFLHELRELTKSAGTALILDEVITGFRLHQGGAQAYFGVEADLASYGKIIGSGMPVGVLAGKAKYLDAIDGGMWNYGDDSYPQADQTFFAGTFCKHPFALAAASAVLDYLEEKGSALQDELNERTAKFAESLNTFFEQNEVPLKIANFGSLFVFLYPHHLNFVDLFFFLLIEKGVSVWGDRTYFLSTAHTDKDIEFITRVVKECALEMQAAGFFPKANVDTEGNGRLQAQSTESQPVSSAEASTDGISAEREVSTGDGEGADARLVPLTEAQEEVWLEAQMSEEASCAYNVVYIYRLTGTLDVEALNNSLQSVVARHDALRTTFNADGEHQIVTEELLLEIPMQNFSSLSEKKRNDAVTALLKDEESIPFDLENGPIFRAQIVKLKNDEHLLIFSTHHLVCDGWSGGVLLNDLSSIYSALVTGQEPRIEKPVQFCEYARLQKQQHESAEVLEAEAYWLKQFEGSIPILELPTDLPRPAIKTNNGFREILTIDREFYSQLKNVATKLNSTMYTLLLSGFNVLLHRLTGQDDIVVGIPVAGQTTPGFEDLVGHCANLLPIRSKPTPDMPFSDLFRAIKNGVFDAHDHQNYTFGRLIRKLNIPRDPSRIPLVSVIFNVDRVKESDSGWHGLEVEGIAYDKSYVSFELSFDIRDTGVELIVNCDSNSDLFGPETIRRWLGNFETLLKSVVSDPSQSLSKLTLLTEAERTQLLQDWNSTERPYSSESCLHKLFEAQAAQHPGKVAVVFGEEKVTYGELDSRANQLARYLQKQGIGSESLVGICVERSAAMVVGLLGVLKAGGAYVPMDPDYPSDRLAVMIEDSKVEVLLTESDLDNIPAHSGRIVYLDSDWAGISSESTARVDSGVGAENRAYVIYTSGSTGRPKGVQIEHRAVVNFLESMAETPGLGPNDVLMAVTTLSFDISILEIFLPLTVGGQVVVASREIASDGRLLAQAVSDSGTTVMQATPATWRMLLEVGWEGKEDLKILCGGEALPRELATQLMSRGGSLWNMYGPTETTIWSAVSEITDVEESVSIGPPIANTTFYVLDAAGEPVPIGVPGELHIGGVGLARGYLGRSELTSEKFIKDPFSVQEDARMYRTGDLVRYLPDGHIEFIARIDHQVKIRGFRIELGEIEAVLEQHESIQTAVVIAREDTPGDKRLVAYVGGGSGNIPDAGELRPFLQQKLPDYMVPSFFVGMKEFPLTPSGKIDRKALPEPDMQRIVGADHIMPTSLMETTIASIWQEILHVDNIGVSDNFFDLGGHSLLAMKFVSEMEKKVGYRISPRDMMFQSLGQLAAVCEKQSGPGAKKHPKRSRRKFLDTLKEVLS
jgi:amino acid adenylation domain-containing protein